MAKGTGLIKSRDRYIKLMDVFPERKDFYLERLAVVNEEIIRMKVCKRCGRPLKDPHTIAAGYGRECQTRTEAALEEKTT